MDQKTVDNICRISMEFGELAGKKKLKLPDDYAATDYLVDHALEWSEEFEKSFAPDFYTNRNRIYLCNITGIKCQQTR